MRTVPYDYQAGRPYAICDRCGFKYRLDELQKEWTGLMVCADDYDPRPADLLPPRIGPEGVPLPDSRPEPPDTFILTPVLARDL